MYSNTEKFTMNLADRTAVKNSFNPPSSFQTTSKDKYGKKTDDSSASPQEIFNEDCTQGVELVVETIRKLRASGKLDLPTAKLALKGLLERLAKIRNGTAVKTGTIDAELFGRSRKENPLYKDGKHIIDITRIFNPQHKATHDQVKLILKMYAKPIICEARKQNFGYEGVANDNQAKPNSRYVIRVYTQQRIEFQPKDKTQNPTILEVTDDNMAKINALAMDPNYTTSVKYNCPTDIKDLFDTLANEHPDYYKKDILVGEIQIKIGDKFIPATRHVSWHHENWAEFDAQSVVVLYHMLPEYHEEMFNKIAEQWFAALSWNETAKEDPMIFNNIMADLQFYFSNSMFHYRGGAAISKVLSKGTYYEQGFLPRPTVSEIDEDCTALYFPFIEQHRKKFVQCFDAVPTSERTREFTLKQGRFTVNAENDAPQSTASSTVAQVSQNN